MNNFKTRFRKVTTIVVACLFVVLASTGLIMNFYPHAMPGNSLPQPGTLPVQQGADSFLHSVREVHEAISMFFVIVAVLHIINNWKPLVASFVGKKKTGVTV